MSLLPVPVLQTWMARTLWSPWTSSPMWSEMSKSSYALASCPEASVFQLGVPLIPRRSTSRPLI